MSSTDIEEHEIDLERSLALPTDFTFHETQHATVVVSGSSARWLILRHSLSTEFLKLLSAGASPSSVVLRLKGQYPRSDVMEALDEVLTELIDKEFFPERKSLRLFTPDYKMMTFTLTNACNLRCKTCYRYCGAPETSELSSDQWHRLLRQFASLDGLVLRISGGEPLFLHKDLTLELINAAFNFGMKTLLLTNGTLIDKSTAKEMEAVGLDRLQISLDGCDASTNDAIRGRGVFQKVLNAIDCLRNTEIDIFIAVVPVPGISLEKLESDGKSFFAFLQGQLGRPLTVSIAQGILKGRFVDRQDDLSFIQRCRALQENVLTYNTSAGLDLWQWEPGRRNTSCGLGCSLTIEPNGDVLQCAGGAVVTNVQSRHLREAIKALKTSFTSHSVDNLPSCKLCEIRYLCGGPCRIDGEECTEGKRHDILSRLVMMNRLRYERVDG